MNSKTRILVLSTLFLFISVFRASAQDSGYLPDLPGFPSGTYAQVAAVGAKIHGHLSAKEMDPVTGDLKRFIRMTYYGPTDTYARMGICSLYTDPKIVAGYSNPSKEDGRDVLVERRSVKYYRRDGSGGGYSLWYYKAGAVDKLFEYEFQSEDIGMPSPGAVGRPFENLSSSHRLEIQFVPKATIFTLKNEESRRPDDVMGAMLLRLEGAAGAASEEVQGIIELGSMALDPYKLQAIGMAWNMGQAIVHWDQTMAAIQRQVDDTANTYWESRLGLINPEDAYRKEGAFLFHLASNVTGGWVVKGAGKTVAKLAGKVDKVGSLAAKNADDVIHVSPNGVAFPPDPKYQIPFNYIENPNRSGSYGVMQNGKFVEKLRVDAATPPGMKGPNYGHYHLDGEKPHYSPRPGDLDPGFSP